MTPSARSGTAVLAVALSSIIAAVPASPAFADSVRDQQWYLSDLDIAQAHRITTGAGVTVALIDSGVNADHQDLKGAILAGTDVHTGADGDGRTDHDGHGTEMAGIIAGRGHGPANGVLGIAPRAEILPIAAPTGSLTNSAFLISAIDYAIAQHVGVINMSFAFQRGDDAMHAAIQKAAAADIVLVAGTGNKGQSGDYPARYPEVLAVGAYGRDGNIASFSIGGPQVDIAAPGVDIVTTSDRGAHDYYDGRGTSEATAMVSGAAALLRARFPKLSAAEIAHRLTATAIDAGPKGRDDSYGSGRLDIVKALTADVPPLAPSAAPGQGSTAAPAGASAAEPDDLPAAKSPLVLIGIVVGLLVLIGIVVVVLVARRRRTAH